MSHDEDISDFIRVTFRSVWALELLCILRKQPDRALSHAEMVAGLRGSDAVVTRSLASLLAAGLVLTEADGSARYAPAGASLDAQAAAAVDMYRVSPQAVRRLIISSANPGITAFADSFRLRKD